MFASFFPKPRLLFLSAVLWTAVCMGIWYWFAQGLGQHLCLGWIVGVHYPPPAPGGGDAARTASAENIAVDAWLYQYMLVGGAIFALAWRQVAPHPWFRWSVVGSSVILFIVWFQVQLDVLINNWFGTFYDMIQKALGSPGSITSDAYFGQLVTFLTIAMIYIFVAVFNAFLVSHYIFRWRTAMNDYYVANWQKLKTIEGASQRVQEDTMRFASTVENLGVSLVDSVMTLIAFLPILWGLSSFVKELPIVGHVPQALVFVAIIWAIFGTSLLAMAGIRLPGLQFRNQRVEAAYRKELVLGEDDADRARPPTLADLFANVRRNYFRIYLNYLYFNVARYGYLGRRHGSLSRWRRLSLPPASRWASCSRSCAPSAGSNPPSSIWSIHGRRSSS
jgi:peptide/bleomycin uptake transporter